MKKTHTLISVTAIMLILCLSLSSCSVLNATGGQDIGKTVAESIIENLLRTLDLGDEDIEIIMDIISERLEKMKNENQGGYTVGEEVSDDDYIYVRLEDGTYGIKKFIGAGDWFSIVETVPSEYAGVTVTRICEGAYRNIGALSTVKIPSTVKVIEANAFSDCSQLYEVELSEGLEEIGRCAFENCSSLNRIHIPGSVSRMGYGVLLLVSDDMVVSCVAAKQPSGWDPAWYGFCEDIRWGVLMTEN